MAGALHSATYQLNATSAVDLTVADGAVDESVDLVREHSADFPNHSADKKTVLLSRLYIDAIDEGSVHKTQSVYLGRDLHKLFHFLTSPGDAGILVDETTTIGSFFAIATELRAGFWMPQKHNGTEFRTATLTATDLGDLFNPDLDFHIGLELLYVKNSTTKYMYADVTLPGMIGNRWSVDSIAYPANDIKPHFVESLVVCTVSPVPSRWCDFEAISTDIMNTAVLGYFGLDITDVDAASEIEITPFAYVGAVMAEATSTAPEGLGYFSDSGEDVTHAKKWSKKQTVTSANEMEITSCVHDAYNDETFTEGDYGWLSDYDKALTTDTSVNITITT